MSTVVVTGAGGFVGQAVVAALAEAGCAVRAILRAGGSAPAFAPGVETVVLPSLDQAGHALAAACAGAAAIVHLADNPVRTAADRAGSEALADAVGAAAQAAGVERVVFASSIYASLAEAGQPNAYGEGKRLAEQSLFARAGVATVALRLPPVYGPGAKGGIAMLAALVRRGWPVPFGSARAKRDYFAIDNLAALIVALVRADQGAFTSLAGRAHEPCDGAPVATADLARLVGAAMGRNARLVPVPQILLALPAQLLGRRAQVDAVFAPLRCEDDSELRQATGWRPNRDLAQNLAYLAR